MPDDIRGGAKIGIVGGPAGQCGEEVGAPLGTGAREEAMAAVEKLREREVERPFGGRPGSEGRAEARGGGAAAFDGDDEGAAAT